MIRGSSSPQLGNASSLVCTHAIRAESASRGTERARVVGRERRGYSYGARRRAFVDSLQVGCFVAISWTLLLMSSPVTNRDRSNDTAVALTVIYYLFFFAAELIFLCFFFVLFFFSILLLIAIHWTDVEMNKSDISNYITTNAYYNIHTEINYNTMWVNWISVHMYTCMIYFIL